ncbi:MAG TPA: hypothetical protein VFJ49_11540, partial [Methyloceanibacter sp.]|nr:hypothetical protein [Methyloceanibacter sp.]
MDGAATCWATDLAISDGCLAVETGIAGALDWEAGGHDLVAGDVGRLHVAKLHLVGGRMVKWKLPSVSA